MADRTFLEMQNECLHDDFDPVKYRPYVKIWLNEALHRLRRRLRMAKNEAVSAVTTISGTDTYSLPSDCVRAHELRSTVTNDRYVLTEAPIEDFDARGSTENGKPLEWALYAGSIVLWPTPDGAYALQLRYDSDAASMSADTDVPGIDDDYVDVLVSYARSKAFRAEGDIEMARALMDDYRVGVAEAANDLNHQSRPKVRQVQGMIA